MHPPPRICTCGPPAVPRRRAIRSRPGPGWPRHGNGHRMLLCGPRSTGHSRICRGPSPGCGAGGTAAMPCGEETVWGRTSMDTIRLGCGAGFFADRLGPAIDLAQRGALDYLVFECIGERTMAFGHRDRMLNPGRGYNPQLAARMRGVLSHCHANGTRVITNMGVANPRAAAL